MRLTHEQRDVIDDWFNSITDSGSVFDDVLGEDGQEQRYLCATPKEVLGLQFPDSCTVCSYCVLTFNPVRGITFIHFYTDYHQAMRDQQDFPYMGY